MVDQKLPESLQKTLSRARDKGASNWLTVIPLEDEGYFLNKEEFRDAICLRYGLTLKGLPSKCPCNNAFNISHALNCKKGGFIHMTMRNDEIRNLEAKLLSQVCKDVAVEPKLIPVTGENFILSSANTEDNARLDVKARSFFRDGQTAFFDVRITNVNAESNKDLPTEAILRKAENDKKRVYNQRVIEIEQRTFTPLVFGTNSAMAKECQIVYKLLAKNLSLKRNKKYCEIMLLIGTQISFSLLRSMLICIRGSRTVF